MYCMSGIREMNDDIDNMKIYVASLAMKEHLVNYLEDKRKI